MTADAENRLRRALDDVLTTCWAEDIPVLDAVAESIEDWAALTAAEFNDSRTLGDSATPSRLASAAAILQSAVRGCPAEDTEQGACLADALADWVREFGGI